jgi:AhpD family alkylhydroperoxidase
MPRITPVPLRQGGLRVKLIYFLTRRNIARVTGRERERMLEPLQMFAHVPRLLRGYAKLEQATAGLGSVDKRLRALAELKAATLIHCEYCIDIGSHVSRRWGLTDEELLALPRYRTSELFTDLERLVMDYAVAMTRTPPEVSDELVALLRVQLDDSQLVELTYLIALESLRGRFNLALGVGAAGFSQDGACAVPAIAEPVPTSASGRHG